MQYELTPEQVAIRERARRLADEEFAPRAREWDETESYPWPNVERLVEAGFMGMTIPVADGGPGRSVMETILVIEQVARACGVTARVVVEGNLGTVGSLIHYGTPEQKRRYLPWVLAGEKPVIAISEPDAGSAANELTTRAVHDGDSIVLKGEKYWITGAGVSRLYLVYARFRNIPGAGGVGAVLVEADTPGLTVRRRAPMLGLRGIPEGEVVFEDCRVPASNLLVPAGDGFKKLMTAYNGQRLGSAAVAIGIAQGAYEAAVRFARERRQFGQPISEFQGLRWLFADMLTRLEAARLLVYRAAAAGGHGFPPMLETSQAKLFACETAIEVTNQALQMFGARGYSRDYPLERMFRDVRMFTIGGGTAQMQRNLIAGRIFAE